MTPTGLLLFFAVLLAVYTLVVVGLSWSAERQRRRAAVEAGEVPPEVPPAGLEAAWRTAVAWVEAHPRARLGLEWLIILLVCLLLAHNVLDLDPQRRPAGADHEALTGLLTPAQLGLQQQRRIPAWNAYAGTGEPLLGNPFNYALNPLASLPVLLLGGLQGSKIAIFLCVFAAGLSAWVLAHALGLGAAARLTGALFYMGSGGIGAKFYAGHFQLGASLVWPPLVLAGVWLTLTTRIRWPAALAAVAFALLVFSGSLHYVLPTLACAVVMVLIHAVHYGAEAQRLDIDREALRRVLIAGALALGLCAVQLVPLLAVRTHLLHSPEASRLDAYGVDAALTNYTLNPGDWARLHPDETAIDYAYVGLVPFALLALVIVPARRHWAAWLAAAVGFAVMLLWGAGQIAPVQRLYTVEPLLAQYADVGRAHTVGALWVALLAALALDDVWRRVRAAPPRWRTWFMGALALAVAVGVVDLLGVSGGFYATARASEPVRWWLVDVKETIAAQTRLPAHVYFNADIGAYLPYELALKNWRGGEGWTPAPAGNVIAPHLSFAPPYALIWDDETADAAFVAGAGYRKIENYRVWGRDLGLYAQPSPLPYAFAISEATLADLGPEERLTGKGVTPAEILSDTADALALWVQVPAEMADPVLVLLETNFPGWSATVDSFPTEVVTVGQYVGVRLGTGIHAVDFMYTPPGLHVGLAISALATAAGVAYVAGAGAWLARLRARRSPPT